MEKVFASVRFSSRISVAVARTSQSPFPLAASVLRQRHDKQTSDRNRKSKPF